MPIDEALKDMKEIDKSNKRPEKSLALDISSYYQKPWHEKLIKLYLKAIHERAVKEASEHVFDFRIMELYAPWMKFATEGYDIGSVPKEYVLRIFNQRCPPEVEELIAVSDAGKYLEELEDPVVLSLNSLYEKIPPWMQLKQAVGADEIYKFLSLGFLIILGLYGLSIFIEQGETLRKYAEFSTQQDEDIIETLSENCDKDFFDAQTLLNFCKKTGTRKIKEMCDQTNALLQALQSKLSDATDSSASAREDIARLLYTKLLEYNPDLTQDAATKQRKNDDIPF